MNRVLVREGRLGRSLPSLLMCESGPASAAGQGLLQALLGQHASDQLEPEEIVRRLVRAVLEHQLEQLADDATLVLFQWKAPPSG